MDKKIFFYKYESLSLLKSFIEFYGNLEIRESRDILEYNVVEYERDLTKSINLYKRGISKKILILRNKKILVIYSKREFESAFFEEKYKIKKIDLLDKYFFCKIFCKNYSRNLVSLDASILHPDAVNDEIDIIGSNIEKTEEFFSLQKYIDDPDTSINLYAFQPKNKKIIVEVSNFNKITIYSTNTKYQDILYFIKDFSDFIKKGEMNER